jgi:chemosensory pili system protein ChpA (sensor histidine kinase/response regulator)
MRLQDDIDFTTLTWVKQELDDTLKQAQQALEAFVDDTADKSQMRFCASYLHQVQGTLRMVELYGAAMVVEEMERLALGLLDGQIKQAEDAYTVLMRGMVQLPDYLERLQSGHRDIPIVLLPLLNDLRACRGEKLLSETSLFSPDLGTALPPSAAGAKSAVPQSVIAANGGRLRLAYQFGLLKWFKGDDVDGNLTRLIAIVDRVRSMCVQVDARRLFWVAAGALEAVLVKGVDASVALKLLAGRVDRELKHLIDAGETGFGNAPPSDLVKSLLYYVAQSKASTERITELRQVYRLDRLMPSEAELEHARGALSGHNRALLETVGTAIKEDLLRVKDALDLYLRTGSANVDDLAPQGEALHRVADTLGMLGLGVPRRVVLDQQDVLERIVRGRQPAEESALLDIAGSLLYVESSLDDHIERLGADQRGAPLPSSGFELPQAEVRKILDATTKEASANIQQAKQDIVAFIESPWDHSKIEQIPRLLEEISGAMRMLNLPEPAELLGGVIRFAEVELLQHRRVPSGDQLDLMADAIASIEFYLEAVKEGRRNRDKILDVTRRSLEALGYWPLPPEGGYPEVTVAPEVAPVEAAPAVSDFPSFSDSFVTERTQTPEPEPAAVEPAAPMSDAGAVEALIASFAQTEEPGAATEAASFAVDAGPGVEMRTAVEIAEGPGLEALVVGETATEALSPSVHDLEGLRISTEDQQVSPADEAAATVNVDDFAAEVDSAAELAQATEVGGLLDELALEPAADLAAVDVAAATDDSTELNLSIQAGEIPAEDTSSIDFEAATADAYEAPAAIEFEAPAEVENEAPAAIEFEAPAAVEFEAPVVAELEVPAAVEFDAPVDIEPEAAAQFEPVVEAVQAPTPVAPTPPPALVMPPGITLPDVGFHSVPSDEIDDEIREVFVEEVQDELDNLNRQYPAWKNDLGDPEKLKPVRRSFHTLKGSGRLVGALAIGEYAWKIENMLNRVLDKTIQPSPAVLDLLDHAIAALPGMLAALKGEGQPDANVGTIMWVADQLATGQEVWLPKSSPAPVVTAEDQPAAEAGAVASPVTDLIEIDAAAETPAAVDADVVPAVDHDQDTNTPSAAFVGAPESAELAQLEIGESDEHPGAGDVETARQVTAEEVTENAGDEPSPLDVDPMLMEILSSEVDAHLATIRGYLDVTDASGPMPVTEELLRAVHTLNGALSMVDLPDLTRVVAPLEGYLKRLRARAMEPSDEGLAALHEASGCIAAVMVALETHSEPPDTAPLAERVLALRDGLPAPDHPFHGFGIHVADEARDDQAAEMSTLEVEGDGLSPNDALPWYEAEEDSAATTVELTEVFDASADADAEAVGADAGVHADELDNLFGDLDVTDTAGEPALPGSAESGVPVDAGGEKTLDSELWFDAVGAEQSANTPQELHAAADDETSPDNQRWFEAAVADESAETAEESAETLMIAPAMPGEEAREAATQADSELVEPLETREVDLADLWSVELEAVPEPDFAMSADAEFERLFDTEEPVVALNEGADGELLQADATEAAVGEAQTESAPEESAGQDASGQVTSAEDSGRQVWSPDDAPAALALSDAPAEAEVQAETETETETEAEAEAEAETEAEAEAEAETEFQAEAEVAVEIEAEAEAEAEFQADAEAETAAEAQAEAEVEAQAEVQAEVATESAVESETEFDVETESDIEAESELTTAETDLETSAQAVDDASSAGAMGTSKRAAKKAAKRAAKIAALKAAQQALEDAASPGIPAADHPPAEVTTAAVIATAGKVADSEPTVVGPADVDPSGPLDLPDMDLELLDIFVEEAVDILDHADGMMARLRESPGDREPVTSLQRDLHTLKGGARMAGLFPIGDLSHAMESLFEAIVHGERAASRPAVEALERAFDRLHGMVQRVRARQAIGLPEHTIARLEAILEGREEEYLAAHAESLGGDVAAPVSAEPAAETAPDSATQDAATVVDAAATPEAEAVPARKVIPARPSSRTGVQRRTQLDDDEVAARAAQQELIRVRADLLDNLVNFAGEVSIYRSRLEAQMGGFRFNLVEFEQTVLRLREQLRKLEMETEAQILSRFQRESEQSGNTEFDPLELDRFSTLQQLSRALAESVSDLVSIQNLLDDIARQSETLLLQQSRVSSDLQEGLMRTRMVPFESLVPRLRRILRQTAAELGKRAQLKVEGTQGEMDRTVLERMTAPFEHMLRNSLAHGIEPPELRQARGKPEEGTVSIKVSREATEVLIQVTDDGGGMNRDAIRRKAIERGLMTPEVQLSDRDIFQFVLEAGFSTASEVSKVAGRGVGMDVVASEVKQLGGSLELDSDPGQGTRITIRLPFTLAVSQAVMVKLGEGTYAIPMSSITGVTRMPRKELDRRLEQKQLEVVYGGEVYQIYDLGDLLRSPVSHGLDETQVPLLMSKTGDQRAAVRVTQVVGSKEVVVKSAGLQLSIVPGIFGATIMGDGRVVVILDLAPLVRHGVALRQAPELAAELELLEPLPEPAVRRQPLVMVVDDSITMRKVTTRVLERSNFDVFTAKDGLDAVEQLQDRMPDVILLDIEMPRMDGYEVATYIRNDQRLKHIPIIMITSRTGEKHRQRALEVGVDRYLGKPYQEADLLKNVQDALVTGHANVH